MLLFVGGGGESYSIVQEVRGDDVPDGILERCQDYGGMSHDQKGY